MASSELGGSSRCVMTSQRCRVSNTGRARSWRRGGAFAGAQLLRIGHVLDTVEACNELQRVGDATVDILLGDEPPAPVGPGRGTTRGRGRVLRPRPVTPWLLVTGDFSPRGGMDRANLALAVHLAADPDAELHLVTHRVAGDRLAPGGARVHLARRPFGSHVLGGPFLSTLGEAWAAEVTGRGGRVVVNGGNCHWPDVSWVHDVHAAYTPQTSTTLVRRVKDRVRQGRDQRNERRVLSRVRLAVCNSRRTQRDLVQGLGVQESRTAVIYYGIDGQRFAYAGSDEITGARRALGWDDRPRVLFIGALGDRRKGFDTLFDAWVDLCRDPSWDGHLVVAGTGAEQPLWQRRIADAGLSSRATCLGFREDIERLVAASDVLVHPARYEAYGLGVHEALCRGVPALVSASAGVAERYPAELGYLLIHDPDSATELTARLLAWRDRREAVRRDLRPFADRFRARSWDDMAADIVAAVRFVVR